MWDNTLIRNKFIFLVGAYLNSPVHALLRVRPDLSLKVSLVSVISFFFLLEWDINPLLNPQSGELGIAILFIWPSCSKSYPLDNAIGFPLILANMYLLGSDLSGR